MKAAGGLRSQIGGLNQVLLLGDEGNMWKWGREDGKSQKSTENTWRTCPTKSTKQYSQWLTGTGMTSMGPL